MIRNAPLYVVTYRTDGEVRSSVDQADTCPAARPAPFALMSISLCASKGRTGGSDGPAATDIRQNSEVSSVPTSSTFQALG